MAPLSGYTSIHAVNLNMLVLGQITFVPSIFALQKMLRSYHLFNRLHRVILTEGDTVDLTGDFSNDSSGHGRAIGRKRKFPPNEIVEIESWSQFKAKRGKRNCKESTYKAYVRESNSHNQSIRRKSTFLSMSKNEVRDMTLSQQAQS